MKHLTVRNLVLAAAALCIIYTVTGFFIVPFAARKIIVQLADSQLHRQAQVEKIRFNPYTLKAGLDALRIADGSGQPLFSAKSVSIDLSAASILKLAPVISGVEIDQPALSLALNADNTLSVEDILASFSSDTAPEPARKPFRFSLAGVKIRNGQFEFSDRIRNKTHRIDQLNLDLPLLSNFQEDIAQPASAELSMMLNNAAIQVGVDSRPFDPSMDTRFSLKAGNVDLADYLAYVPIPEGLNIESPGQVALDASGWYAKENQGDTLFFDAVLELDQFDIRTTDGPLLSFPELRIKAGSQNILSKQVSITEAVISGPEITLSRNAEGKLGVLTLFNSPEASQGQEEPAAQDSNPSFSFPISVKVERGGIENGTLVFTDELPEPSFETRLSDLNIIVQGLDLGDEGISGNYDAGFHTETNETLSASGAFSMMPGAEAAGPKLDGRIELKGIRPEKYKPYYRPYLGDRVSLGRTDLSGSFTAGIEGDDVRLEINEGSVSLGDLRLTGPKEKASLIDLKKIHVADISVNLEQKQVTLGDVEAAEGNIRIARLPSGKINLAEAVRGLGTSPARAEPSDEQPAGKEPSQPWMLTIDRFSLSTYQVAVADLMHREPVNLNLSDIKIDAEDVSSAPGQEGKLTASMRFQDKGKIGITGTLNLSDLAGGMDLDLSAIDVKSFEPYFTEYLNIFITKGEFASNGRVDFSLPENKPLKVRFAGKASLTDFETKHKGTDIDFFRYKSFYLSGIDVSTSPVKVDIRDVALTDFYHRSVLSKDGRFSISDVLAKEETDDKASAPLSEQAKTPVDINIGTITLQGGHINFSDYFTTPNFTANMTEVAGSIKGLSSGGDAPAELQLKGLHGRHSPLDISGAVDPLKPDPFFDVMISFKNIELPEFNAYSVKYLGYEIEKGKLILDLKYKIDGRALSSNNRVFFDQLTLGDRVESEDATSLPIQLAISLLKNSKGEIDLDLPINGNLDDPEFNYGDVVVTTFSNLILSIVTAPFKFLGSLIGIGDDEDLGYVEFLPGSDEIDTENQEKIDQLVGILAEKESLNIQIEGRYDPAADGEYLRTSNYEALLVSMMQGGDRSKENVLETVTPEVRDALVAAAYAAAEFPKPRDESGKEKEISVAEKEKLLLTSIAVEERDLEEIAARRSERIREQMITRGNIDPGRIFLRDPDPVKDEDQSGTKVKAWFLLK